MRRGARVRAPALLRGVLVGPYALGLLLLPGGAPFDTMENLEAVADQPADGGNRAGQCGVHFGAAFAVRAVVNLIHHGDHSFRLLVAAQRASGKSSMMSLAGFSARSINASRFSASRACHVRAVERSETAFATCSTGPSSMNARGLWPKSMARFLSLSFAAGKGGLDRGGKILAGG